MSERPAKTDYAAVQLAYARWKLNHPDLEPEDEWFDPNQLELDLDADIDDAKARHPARPIQNVQSDAL